MRVLIEWINCVLREKRDLEKCYKCWAFDHLTCECEGPGRSKNEDNPTMSQSLRGGARTLDVNGTGPWYENKWALRDTQHLRFAETSLFRKFCIYRRLDFPGPKRKVYTSSVYTHHQISDLISGVSQDELEYLLNQLVEDVRDWGRRLQPLRIGVGQ